MLSHVIPQCLVTDRIPIKLQLTGKSRLIFKFSVLSCTIITFNMPQIMIIEKLNQAQLWLRSRDFEGLFSLSVVALAMKIYTAVLIIPSMTRTYEPRTVQSLKSLFQNSMITLPQIASREVKIQANKNMFGNFFYTQPVER